MPNCDTFTVSRGFQADEIVAAKLHEIRRAGGRYSRGILVEVGVDHETGQSTYVRKGGAFSRSGDLHERAHLGVTKQDVSDVRSDLSRIGVRMTWDEVDALLQEALHRTNGGALSDLREIEARAEAMREKYRQRRERQVRERRERLECVRCSAYIGDPERLRCRGGCARFAKGRS